MIAAKMQRAIIVTKIIKIIKYNLFSDGVVWLLVMFLETSGLFDGVTEDSSFVLVFVSGSYEGVTDGVVIGRYRDDWGSGVHFSNSCFVWSHISVLL